MELRTYFIPVRKWWWLIVAATAVAALSSYVATRYRVPTYSASATVMIGGSAENPVPPGSDFYRAAQVATTYVDLVQRRPIREATMAALELNFLPSYTARQLPNTHLIEIKVIDTDPARAQAVANELINQLERLSARGPGRDDQQQAFLAEQLGDLQTAIRETRVEITNKKDELAGMFSARQIADAQQQILALQDKLYSLQSNYASLLSNTREQAVNEVTVIEEAELPRSPRASGRRTTVLAAAVIGFILAAVAAYLMEYLDDTLKNPDDVHKVMDVTTLGTIPLMKALDGVEPMPMLGEGPSVATEAFRVLRTNLQFAAVDRPLRTLLITSPAPNEGKSLIAANLAAAIACASKQVVLVDADLHRPRLHRMLGVRNNAGLTTSLLEGQATVNDLLQATAVPGLRLLSTGPLPPNPAELLGSARMRGLLETLSAQADIVLFDSPPVMALADTAILGSQVDGVLMVVSAGDTRREIARRAIVALQQVNARVVGALLNRMPAKPHGYYHYYFYYQHGDYNHDGGDGRERVASGVGFGSMPREATRKAIHLTPDGNDHEE